MFTEDTINTENNESTEYTRGGGGGRGGAEMKSVCLDIAAWLAPLASCFARYAFLLADLA